jgi:excinuclease ABC subunit B
VAGRAARNVNGRVILYGDTVTPSMDALLKITAAHRKLQLEYNRIHNIVPRSVVKSKRFTIAEAVGDMDNSRKKKNSGRNNTRENDDDTLMTVGAGLAAAMPESEFADLLRELEEEMLEAAEKLEFERAAFLRDRINELEKQRQ